MPGSMGTAGEEFLDFICRTCMQEFETSMNADNTKADQQWQSIFDTIGDNASLVIGELLSSVVPQIEVQLTDKLPKKICPGCLEQLQSMHRFQQMCVQSQQQMLEFIAEIKTLPKATEPSATDDPLQNFNEVKVEDCEDSEGDVSVTNEPCSDEEARIEYINNATLNSIITIKDDLVPVEKDEEETSSAAASTYSCQLCNKSFKALRLLKYHLKRHKKWDEQKDKPPQPKKEFEYFRYECNLCERVFFKPETLEKHRLQHNSKEGIRTYPCDVCNKSFTSRHGLWGHKNRLHSGKEIMKKHACEFCDKTFRAPSFLQIHQRKHTGERPFLCPECGKSFSSSGQMNQHRYRHTDVKRYECPHCPMKFTCSSDLSKHKQVHDETKRYACDICDVRFGRSYSLRKHKMQHTGEKPYKCDHCDKRFNIMDSCRRHMRTHTGEKPFKCKYCSLAFNQSGDHVKHLRLHIGENVYRCELCPCTFRLKSEKRLHFATHKNDCQETRERNMKALKEAEAKLQLNATSSKKTRVASSTVGAEMVSLNAAKKVLRRI